MVGFLFSSPGLQNNTPIRPLITVGTIAVLAAFLGNRRYRRLVSPTLLVALAINAVAWAVVWFPQVPHRWLAVSPAAATTLHQVEAKIQPGDEVIASQGVVGGYANRQWIYALELPRQRFPVKAHKVWMIIAPRDGIEELTPSQAYADIRKLMQTSGWHLVLARHDVWAFERSPARGIKSFIVNGGPSSSVAPWTTGGAAGTVVTAGKPSDWHVASKPEPGYTLSGAEWRKRPGIRCTGHVVCLSHGQCRGVGRLTNRLLARTMLQNTHGRTTVQMPVDLKMAPGDPSYMGWGPWRMSAQATPSGDILESASGPRGAQIE